MASQTANGPQTDDQPKIKIPLWVTIVWLCLGATGLLVRLHSKWNDDPFDSTSLAWVVFIVVGFLSPFISELSLPGIGGIKLAEEKRRLVAAASDQIDATKALRRAFDSVTDLLQAWTSSCQFLNAWLQEHDTQADEIRKIVVRFCLERMEEASECLTLTKPARDDAGAESGIRISLWWFDEDKNGLVLLYSNEITDQATLEFVFKPGEGLMGQAFIERRLYNLADATKSKFFAAIPGHEPTYKALLMVPVWFSNRVVGMVSIDRRSSGEFDNNAVDLATALADVLGFALTHPISLPCLR